MSNSSTEHIEEVITNGKRLVKEAREVLAQTDRFYAEHNINPAESLEYLRQHAGDKAVEEVKAQVAATIQGIEEDLARDRMHKTKSRPAGQRARVRPNMI
jgi:transcription elongation GreA/GreB family factor